MIRHAETEDAHILTAISFRSKGYWGYPEEFYEIWRGELTITSGYIQANDVFVYEHKGEVMGYYSIVELKNDLYVSGIKLEKGFWLEHMFVDPPHIETGIGTQLFTHLQERCGCRGIERLGILADPNARGFYEKMGCAYQGEYPSTIENRTTPFLVLNMMAS